MLPSGERLIRLSAAQQGTRDATAVELINDCQVRAGWIELVAVLGAEPPQMRARLCAHPVLECVASCLVNLLRIGIGLGNPIERQALSILFDINPSTRSPVENIDHQAEVFRRSGHGFEGKRRSFDFERIVEYYAGNCFLTGGNEVRFVIRAVNGQVCQPCGVPSLAIASGLPVASKGPLHQEPDSAAII